jgi:hypothetical protein
MVFGWPSSMILLSCEPRVFAGYEKSTSMLAFAIEVISTFKVQAKTTVSQLVCHEITLHGSTELLFHL